MIQMVHVNSFAQNGKSMSLDVLTIEMHTNCEGLLVQAYSGCYVAYHSEKKVAILEKFYIYIIHLDMICRVHVMI